MIKLSHIKKSYFQNNVETKVLKDVNLTINDGEFLCIYGASGCGKSTLLNIIGLLDAPTLGDYYWDNMSVFLLSEKELAVTRNKKIGFVFQTFNLVPELDVLENIAVPLGYAGKSRHERILKAKELLKEFDMGNFEKKYPHQLSGGEQQRIAILRAISNSPKVLVADEPTGNLDKENSIRVMELFKRLNGSGMTIILVTHDTNMVKYASRVIHIENGCIVEK